MIDDWTKEYLEKIKQIYKAVIGGFVSDEIAEERYNICLKCDYFVSKKCSLCECHMPVKVLFKNSECPNKYWGNL
jgi:hypothetical protein